MVSFILREPVSSLIISLGVLRDEWDSTYSFDVMLIGYSSISCVCHDESDEV